MVGLFAFIVIQGLFLISFSPQSLVADDYSHNLPSGEEVDTLKKFFAYEHINIDTNDMELLNKYDKHVIKKMKDFLELVNGKVTDRHQYELEVKLNTEINEQILEDQIKRAADKPNKLPDFDSNVEGSLNALELMVPDNEHKQANRDLRKYYIENKVLARELIARLEYLNTKGELHTFRVARLLEKFYSHWIPLGRLMSIIES